MNIHLFYLIIHVFIFLTFVNSCVFLLLLPHLWISSTLKREFFFFSVHLISVSFYCPCSYFPVEWLDSSVHHRKFHPLSRPHSFSLLLSYSFWFFFPFCFWVLSVFCFFFFVCLSLSFGFKVINVAMSMLWCIVRFLASSLVLVNLISLKTWSRCKFYVTDMF